MSLTRAEFKRKAHAAEPKRRTRKCAVKSCRQPFEPHNMQHKCCGPVCDADFAMSERVRKERKERQEGLKALKPIKWWRAKAKTAMHAYVRAVAEGSTSDYAAKPDGSGFSDVGIEDGMLLERAAARVMGELADRGWNAEWITLSASDVGASHGRARWFCFAWRVADARLQHGDLQQRRARPEHQGSRIVMDDAELSERRAQRVGGTCGEQGNDGGRHEANGGTGIADQALDDTNSAGAQRTGRAESGADSGCEELADSERARRTPARRGFELDAGCEPESGRGAVADTERVNCERRGIAGDMACAGGPTQGEARKWEWRGPSIDCSDSTMADTDGSGRRLEGGHQQQSSGVDRRDTLLADTSGSRLQRFQRSGGGF